MNRAARGTFWLIAKYENRRLAVLTIDRGAVGETLPVFSYEEEADAYLWFASPGTGWRARKTTAGELVSVLCGPCAGAKKVALDPLPVVDRAMVDLVSLPRKRFVQILMGAPSDPRQSLFRARAFASSDASESSGEKGAWVRENGERREHTEDGARLEPRRLFYLRRGSYEAPREMAALMAGVVLLTLIGWVINRLLGVPVPVWAAKG
jgi:hypothetical protein